MGAKKKIIKLVDCRVALLRERIKTANTGEVNTLYSQVSTLIALRREIEML